MHKIHVVQGDLAGFQHNWLCRASVVLRGSEFLVQRNILAIAGIVLQQGLLLMGAGYYFEASVFRCGRVQCDPNRTGGQGAYWPVFTVLMPWCGMAAAGRLGKKARIPQREIRSDQLLNHIQNICVSGYIQKAGIVCQ